MTTVTTYAQQSWNIVNSRIATYCEQVYNISYISSISSSFEILGDFEVYYESEYVILPYDEIEAEFESIYVLVDTGILGITERIVGLWGAWYMDYSNRIIHLHLSNAHVTERTSLYNRYYQTYSNITLLISRVILSTERNVALTYYSICESEKHVITSSAISYYTNRYCNTCAFQIHTSQRTTICLQLLSTYTDRICYVLEAYSSYRNIFFTVWYESERWIVTHAKEKSIYIDQRYAYVEIVLNRYESIRMIYTEICSLSYALTINPSYVSYNMLITNEEVIAFENEKVIDNNIVFTDIPINVTSVSNDIIIVSDDTTTPIIYASSEAVAAIEFTQISGTDSFIYRGNIITTKETLFLKLHINISTIEYNYTTATEYIEYLQRVGYIKVEIGNKEILSESTTIIDVPAFTKIPIVIQVHKNILDIDNAKFILKYAYPYNGLVVNKILLVGWYDSI